MCQFSFSRQASINNFINFIEISISGLWAIDHCRTALTMINRQYSDSYSQIRPPTSQTFENGDNVLFKDNLIMKYIPHTYLSTALRCRKLVNVTTSFPKDRRFGRTQDSTFPRVLIKPSNSPTPAPRRLSRVTQRFLRTAQILPFLPWSTFPSLIGIIAPTAQTLTIDFDLPANPTYFIATYPSPPIHPSSLSELAYIQPSKPKSVGHALPWLSINFFLPRGPD